MKSTALVLIILALASGPANSALQSRLSGQAYYDDVRDVTWLADANFAATNTFGVVGIGVAGPGTMAWAQAQSWITAMNAANGGLGHLGVDNWRLPKTVQPDPECVTQNSVPGFPLQGSGDGCTGSELGYLRNVQGISSGSMTPFVNVGPTDYWSDTEYAPDITEAWVVSFQTSLARQDVVLKSLDDRLAWAARLGDIDADGDGVTETQDNCTFVANPTQLDADGDNYGNICDPDLNNSGTVTTADFGLLRSVLGQPASFSPLAAAADLNGSGTVTTADFALLRARLGSPPGPSHVDLAYALTVARNGAGTGSVISSNNPGINCGTDCSEIYTRNTLLVLSASPAPGSAFAGWSGACAGTGTCAVIIKDAESVSASFTLLTHTLTVATSGNGTGTVSSSPAGINCGVDCSQLFNANTVVSLAATPASGSTFTGWSGACAGTGSCVVTMDTARSVSASFTLLTHTLTVARSGNGTGTVSSSPAGITCGVDCSQLFNANTVVSLAAIAASGSTFTGWSGACTGTLTCVVTMDSAKSVTANFSLNAFCASNLFLGTVSGDTSSAVLSTSGVGVAWYRARIAEDDPGIFSTEELLATVTLDSTGGADYDLYVYCLSCGGTLAGSSTNAAGTDAVGIRRDDVFASDQSFDVLIEVRYFGGSPGGWNLSVAGDTGGGASSCL